MTASTIRAIAFIALLPLPACVIDRRAGGKPEVMVPTKVRSNGTPNRDARSGFGPKSVQGKMPPTRLIARDGTSCVVSQKKYDSTALGTSVWCTWFDADR